MIATSAFWVVEPFDDAGRTVLISAAEDDLLVLAPPGVRLWLAEPLEHRARWRLARWPVGDNDEQPIPGLDEPEIDHLEAVDALELAGPDCADFFHDVLTTQINLAVTIARRRPDGVRVDIYEQAGGRAHVRARNELEECFPEQYCREAEPSDVPDIPSTIDEVLKLLPGGKLTRTDQAPAADELALVRAAAGL